MLYYEYTRAEWQFRRATRVTGVDVLIIISGRRRSILNKQKREKGKLEKSEKRGEERKRSRCCCYSVASDA